MEVQIVDAANTGRISHSSRWSRGLHEFVEVKECLQVQSESTTVASVSHPSFFDQYENVFGLTGTVGEIEERREIEEVYKVDAFDVPPHRPCKRERLPTTIFDDATAKRDSLLAKVRNFKSKGRPLLLLFPTIETSAAFSTLLGGLSLPHMVLNELQTEDEDYVLFRAGQAGSVTVATNTAGRGTDIVLSREALSNGGLHVIFTFFPLNLRVECQGLGRAARQGQPGSCEICLSRDEPFVAECAELFATPAPTTVESLYQWRTATLQQHSRQRAAITAAERIRFAALSNFFAELRFVSAFLHSEPSLAALQEVLHELKLNRSSSDFAHRLVEEFRQQWANFFTDLCDENGDAARSSGDASDPAKAIFSQFLRYAKWELTSACADVDLRAFSHGKCYVLFRSEDLSLSALTPTV
jgi:preprotein translocase subunit SecA